MSGVIGQGTAVYTPTGGSAISFKFHSPAGFKILSRSVPVVDSTKDSDTTKVYEIGNLVDNGEFNGTYEILATQMAELKSMVPTKGALVWTSDLEVSSNGTQCTISGNVGFYAIDLDAEENGLLKGPAKFKWLDDVTVVEETA